jgi:hypothetical protein
METVGNEVSSFHFSTEVYLLFSFIFALCTKLDLHQEINRNALEEVKKTTKIKKKPGSLGKIRLDLQHMGVRTTSPAAITHRINVFNDRCPYQFCKL